MPLGSYQFQAVYSGDSNYSGSTSAVEPLAIRAAPSVTVTPVPASATVGTAIDATANLTGGHTPFTGTVTFNLYAGSTCTGPTVSSSTNPVIGATATSDSFSTSTAGAFSSQSIYNGDPNDTTAFSNCAPVAVSPGSPTLVTTPSPTTVTLSASAHRHEFVTPQAATGSPV